MSAEALKERLRADLKAAMKSRESGEAGLLRTLIAAIDNAEAVAIEGGGDRSQQRAFGDPKGEVARRELSAGEIGSVLDEEIASRDSAAADYDRHGRAEDARRLREEITLIRRYRD